MGRVVSVGRVKQRIAPKLVPVFRSARLMTGVLLGLLGQSEPCVRHFEQHSLATWRFHSAGKM